MDVNAILDLERRFLGSLQQAPSRVHNVLRNVGKFPLIITTNMDELLERFLWKAGNGGEKIRLDQVIGGNVNPPLSRQEGWTGGGGVFILNTFKWETYHREGAYYI